MDGLLCVVQYCDVVWCEEIWCVMWIVEYVECLCMCQCGNVGCGQYCVGIVVFCLCVQMQYVVFVQCVVGMVVELVECEGCFVVEIVGYLQFVFDGEICVYVCVCYVVQFQDCVCLCVYDLLEWCCFVVECGCEWCIVEYEQCCGIEVQCCVDYCEF